MVTGDLSFEGTAVGTGDDEDEGVDDGTGDSEPEPIPVTPWERGDSTPPIPSDY